MTDVANDKSLHSSNNDNSDNENQNNDYSDNENQNNDYSDNSTNDSNNDNSHTDNSTANSNNDASTNVSLADSLNDYSSSVEDSFNSDDDLIDVAGLCNTLDGIIGQAGGDAMNADGGQALLGNGNVFSIQQIATLNDGDWLNQPSTSLQMQNGSGAFSMNASELYGGTANATHNGDLSAGNSSTLSAGNSAASGISAGHEALNMDISMGANIQFTSVDMAVVGGDAGGADFGDA